MKSSMMAKIAFFTAVVGVLLCSASPGNSQTTPAQSLAGPWRFQLDRTDAGLKDQWFTRDLTDSIRLPGILQAQGYGDEVSTNTPWVLSLYDKDWFLREDYQAHTQPGKVRVPFVSQPERHYLGVAWYQRDIEIPKEWAGRRVVLFLERTRWETRAWLDDKLVGTNRSLCTPHEFDFGMIPPGKHRLTVRVDNRMLMNYRPDAHAVSDSLGSTWNGIVGRIELRSTPPVWIEELRVSSDLQNRRIKGYVTLGNQTTLAGAGQLNVSVSSRNPKTGSLVESSPMPLPVKWSAGGGEARFEIELGERAWTWDEFAPSLHHVAVMLAASKHVSSKSASFGLRDFKTSGQDFIINGRPTHLRGTHHGGDFPLTGYPPCDVEYWRKLLQKCKEWGLNHVRFHSFCPPEAAFIAADEIGIYLQPEPGMWNEISPGTPMEQMLYEETERMIKSYGNHPSFALLSASNEAKGRWKEACSKWVQHFRKLDPRRLYTPDTGWSLIDEPGPVGDRADYLAVHRIGQNLMRGERGWFGRDYGRGLRGVDVPNVVHENGQWCAYPDFEVIKKFTGFIRPGNYEIFRDSAAAHGVLEYNQQFAHASGRFQLACYKEEIEANLRTPGLAGFQLLDLHDYTGQGTALVGVLDPFWESKGYVTAEEWRQFCSPLVPLARLTKRVFTPADEFEVPVEAANYSATALTNAVVTWQLQSDDAKFPARGQFAPMTLPVGRTPVGTIKTSLAGIPAAARYRLVVAVTEPLTHRDVPAQPPANVWNFWLYPAVVRAAGPTNVLVTSSWAEAETRLAAGGRVIFQPPQAHLDWSSPPLDRVPIFWNRLMGPGWSRMLGLWCDPQHPALAGFPTEANCDWQWTEIIKTRAINLDPLPRELSPIVAAIDDWNRNWKLGLIFEARVGTGKLLVTAFDLQAESVVAKQLRRSLLDYAAGEKFQPAVTVAAADLRRLWFDTLVMRKLGAQVAAEGRDAAAAIDGDPNTFWQVGVAARNVRPAPRPHEFTVSFPEPLEFNGLVLLNRQNDRNHQGDIRAYALSISEDGQHWREIQRGELASTWSPQTLRLSDPVRARSLKLTALGGFGSDTSSALAELAVLPVGRRLPDAAELKVEYRRARCTSTDIDEGDPTATP
jgi:hypothetical protein